MTDFGRDFSCLLDLSPTLAVVSGRRLLAEAIARRILTPRGTLLSNPNYGIDVRDWLSEGVTPAQLARVAPQIDAELSKDERILQTATTCTLLNGKLTISIIVTDGGGPFLLVLSVSDNGVTIDKLEAI